MFSPTVGFFFHLRDSGGDGEDKDDRLVPQIKGTFYEWYSFVKMV